MAHPLDGSRAKVNRAKQHIEDFQVRALAFYQTNPCIVGVNEDAERGQRLYYVASLAEVPETLASIAADAVQNLRTPLDYIATQIETAACGATPKHRVYFPIGRDAAHYETLRRAYIKCADQTAIDAFDATEPYKGGKGHALWQINELNKPDKHVFPLTVSAGYSAFDAGVHLRDGLRKVATPSMNVDRFPSIFLRLATGRCPLEVGYVLMTEPLELEVHEPRKFVVGVSLHKPGVIECEPALKSLQDFSDLVDGIVTAFEPLL